MQLQYPMRFSYTADRRLASEFENQMMKLVREHKGDGECLPVHPDDDPSAKGDPPEATALCLLAAKAGDTGELLIA